MSDILIIQHKETTDAIIATALIRRLLLDGNRIHCLTDDTGCQLFKYGKKCFAEPIQNGTKVKYDLAINLSASKTACDIIEYVVAKEKLGYRCVDSRLDFYNIGADLHYRARHIGIPTAANQFQLLFGIANRTWHGEGFWISYFPKNRTKRNLVGVATQDKSLGQYIWQNLHVNRGRLWDVPLKHNVLKQIDEINRCKSLITDSEFILYIGLALRKNIEYIVRKKPTFTIEMFRNGHIHYLSKIIESKLQ